MLQVQGFMSTHHSASSAITQVVACTQWFTKEGTLPLRGLLLTPQQPSLTVPSDG